MTIPSRKILLERDIKVLQSLLDGMCRKELPDPGRRHIKRLIESRKDDINKLKDIPGRSEDGHGY
jgi:hypothetical protein